MAMDRRPAPPRRMRRERHPDVTRPEHAFHALEVMLAAKRSAAEGRVIKVDVTFPDLDYGTVTSTGGDLRGQHRPADLVKRCTTTPLGGTGPAHRCGSKVRYRVNHDRVFGNRLQPARAAAPFGLLPWRSPTRRRTNPVPDQDQVTSEHREATPTPRVPAAARDDWEARIARRSDEAARETTPDLPPPTGLRADPGVGHVRLSWEPVEGAIGYLVHRAPGRRDGAARRLRAGRPPGRRRAVRARHVVRRHHWRAGSRRTPTPSPPCPR